MKINNIKLSFFAVLILMSGMLYQPAHVSAQSSCGLAVSANGNDVTITWDFGGGSIWGVDWEIVLDGNIIYSASSPSGSWNGFLSDGTYTVTAQYTEGGIVYDDSSGGRIDSSCDASVTFDVDGSGGGGGPPPPPPPPPNCVINSFLPDDDTPAYNTDTTLRIVLNANYPWTITLISGTANSVPPSGTLSPGASNTGNLIATHTYHLTCNGEATVDANREVTVIPEPPGSADDALFISQTINGVLNPSAVTLNAGQAYPVSIVMNNNGTTTWNSPSLYALGAKNEDNNGVWAPTGRVVIPSGQTVGAGNSKTFSFNITPPVNPQLWTCLGTTLPTTCNFQFRMVHDDWNGPIGPQWFGEFTPNLSITVNPPVPYGNISATSCTIAIGGAVTCDSTLNWSTANLTANPTEVRRDNPGGTHISWATSNSNFLSAIGPGSYTFFLYHNNVLLNQSALVTAACVAGGTWNGSMCVINGSCGSSINSCTTGTLQDIADTSTDYLWNCNGISGGTNASCSLPKPPGIPITPTNPTIPNGSCTTLNWGPCPVGTTSATLNGVSVGPPYSGTVQVCPLSTTTYTLACTGPSGTTTGTTTVTVKRQPFFQEN